MEKRLSFGLELLKPWSVRAALFIFAAIQFWDAASNQFGFPKIPRLWGMTPALDPWWAWLLGILMFALFEHVRRNSIGDGRFVGELESGAPIASTEPRIPPSDQAEPAQTDWASIIDGRFEGLRDVIRRAVAEDFDATLQPLKDRLTAAEVITEPLHKQRLDEMRASVVAWVSSERRPMPDPIEANVIPQFPTMPMFGAGARMEQGRREGIMRELGLTALHSLPEVVAAKDAVMKNSRYFVLDDDDKNVWASGEQKQEWHAHNAQVDAKLKYLKDKGYPYP